MGYYIAKVVISSILIVLISEVAKRNSLFAATFASIPLVSVLALIWLYVDTQDVEKVRELSVSILWLVLPSLTLFWTLPVLLDRGIGFYVSLGIALAIMIASYALTLMVWKALQ